MMCVSWVRERATGWAKSRPCMCSLLSLYVTQYDQEFQDKAIILFILIDKTRQERNLQERDNNYRNIVLSCFRAALSALLTIDGQPRDETPGSFSGLTINKILAYYGSHAVKFLIRFYVLLVI